MIVFWTSYAAATWFAAVASLALARGEKSFEAKTAGGESGDGERGGDSRGSWNGHHLITGFRGATDELVTGVL